MVGTGVPGSSSWQRSLGFGPRPLYRGRAEAVDAAVDAALVECGAERCGAARQLSRRGWKNQRH